MLKMFKKSIWIDHEDPTACPSAAQAHAAIAKYCQSNGHTCVFTGDDEVLIDGTAHEIYRGLSTFNRGSYIIKCREK